jgi:hypothetical protein
MTWWSRSGPGFLARYLGRCFISHTSLEEVGVRSAAAVLCGRRVPLN